jgi:hypothetical protein
MGMYDHLRCEYPLPAPNANDLDFQTKDTPAQWLDDYLIDKDGQLFHVEYDTEDQSDPKAEGIMRFAGSMARVNERRVLVTDFTGEICFYDYPGRGEWIEFCSYFIGGKLQSVTLLEDTRAKSEGGARVDASKEAV